MSELLLTNGNILTMDPANPRGQWVAVEDGRILAVGVGNAPEEYQTSSTRVIDLSGKAVLPGFIDTHLHFRALAESLAITPLGPQNGVQSISDIVDRIHDETKDLSPGSWIRAAGYNEVYLSENRHPHRWDLDMAAPGHPVKLTHRSGHAHVLNSRALAYVGIDKETDDPSEGIIDRDLETGEPTGLLWGLNEILSQKIPRIDETTLDRGIMLADAALVSNGITSFQDASTRNDRERWHWFESLKNNGALRPRVTMMLGWAGFKQYQARDFPIRMDENQLCLKGVKIIIDETTGSLHPDRDTLRARVLAIHRAGFQAALHAIEPSAIEAAIDALTHSLAIAPRRDHRHRIEHSSVCPPDLIKKIASLDIMVTTHPAFLYYSGNRYLKTVTTDQQPHLYPIASLFNAGIAVSAASDAPIAGINPLTGIYSAVTRRAETGESVLEEEGISLEFAMQMYTRISSMASFQENIKGTISPGKLADLVVLSDNPFDVPAEDIKKIVVEKTIIGGEIVWSA